MTEDGCKYCHGAEEGKLFLPCDCTDKVHVECLRKWLETSPRSECEVCHAPYRLRKRYKIDYRRLFLAFCVIPVMVLILLFVPIGYQYEGIQDDPFHTVFLSIAGSSYVVVVIGVLGGAWWLYGGIFAREPVMAGVLIGMLLSVLMCLVQALGMLITYAARGRLLWNFVGWGVGFTVLAPPIFCACGVYLLCKKVDMRSDWRIPFYAFAVLPSLLALDAWLMIGINFSPLKTGITALDITMLILFSIPLALYIGVVVLVGADFYKQLYRHGTIEHKSIHFLARSIQIKLGSLGIGIMIYFLITGRVAWNPISFTMGLSAIAALVVVLLVGYGIYRLCRATIVAENVLPSEQDVINA